MTWICIVILIPIAWLFENVMHEASHLFFARLKGLKAWALYPFPHWMNPDVEVNGVSVYRVWRPWELWKKPWPNAWWFFARCTYDAPAKPAGPHDIIPIAPFIWGTSLFVGATISVLFGCLYAMPLAIVGLVDALWFWRGYFWGRPTCDGKRWRSGDA
jgi:hypothetical protein